MSQTLVSVEITTLRRCNDDVRAAFYDLVGSMTPEYYGLDGAKALQRLQKHEAACKPNRLYDTWIVLRSGMPISTATFTPFDSMERQGLQCLGFIDLVFTRVGFRMHGYCKVMMTEMMRHIQDWVNEQFAGEDPQYVGFCTKPEAVLKINPVRDLLARLGFVEVGDTQVQVGDDPNDYQTLWRWEVEPAIAFG